MKQLYPTTFTSGITYFDISIPESFGWIEPVFTLISPNLKDTLRIEEKPNYLIKVLNFEIISLDKDNTCYGIHFFNSNDIIRGDSSELKIIKANFVEEKNINNIVYSVFYSPFCFEESYDYQECSTFYVGNGIPYLTQFFSFSVNIY